jgi:hypothetical protein
MCTVNFAKPKLLFGVFILCFLLLAFAAGIGSERSPKIEADFAKLQVGMTEQQVELCIGIPPGDHRTWQTEPGGIGVIQSFGTPGPGDTTAVWWWVDTHWMYVTFNGGKAEGGQLGLMYRREPPGISERIRKWLGNIL